MLSSDTSRLDLLVDAVLTSAAVVIAFLALDDITTDSAPGFPAERRALAVCATWFVIMAWRLWRRGYRVLAGVSFGAVAVATPAVWAIGPGTVPSLRLEFLATVAGLAWFALLAGLLGGLAWRPRRHAAEPR